MKSPHLLGVAVAIALAVPASSALGADWASVGTDANGAVQALAGDASGNTYAGGTFTATGGASAGRVARWDGTPWNTMGAARPPSSPVAGAVERGDRSPGTPGWAGREPPREPQPAGTGPPTPGTPVPSPTDVAAAAPGARGRTAA